MALAMLADGASTHTGTVCSGSVGGTIDAGSNAFFSVESTMVMVADGQFMIPSHNNPPCVPPNIQSHAYTPDALQNSYFYIGGLLVVVVGDDYTPDPTEATGAGTNTFLTIT
jgi:hypothetical protein